MNTHKLKFLSKITLVTSMIMVSSISQAREVVVSGQMLGYKPFFGGYLNTSGALVVGSQFSFPEKLDPTDADGDEKGKVFDGYETETLEWFIVDKRVSEATDLKKNFSVSSEKFEQYKKEGLIQVIETGKKVIDIKPEYYDHYLGYKVRAKTDTGYPYLGEEYIHLNVWYSGTQKSVKGPDGSFGGATGKKAPNVTDIIEDNGLIDYNLDDIKIVISRDEANTSLGFKKETIYDETANPVTPADKPIAVNEKFSIKLFAPDAKTDVTETYKNAIVWGLKIQAGDDLNMPGDKKATEETIYFDEKYINASTKKAFNTRGTTTFNTQSKNFDLIGTSGFSGYVLKQMKQGEQAMRLAIKLESAPKAATQTQELNDVVAMTDTQADSQ